MAYMNVENVLHCSFQNWYHKFKDLTIPSIILPIPPEVLSYLQDDGTVVVPEEVYNVPRDEDSCDGWQEDLKETNVATIPDLDQFSQKIRTALKKLGGIGFPKLNWSSPKDASWISFNKSLECHNPVDVYLLLKSSDFISHDLTCPFKDCLDKSDVNQKVDYFLVLRKWLEINPSDEFRCFVRNRELIGITQRDVSQYYSSIHKEKDCILDDVILFWEENIRNYYPSLSYAFDVYRPKSEHVTLIDFGPFGPTTDSLLFTWEELSEDDTQEELIGIDSNRIVVTERDPVQPEFRYIQNATGVQPSPYMRYGLPLDVVDLGSGEDPVKLADFLKMKIQKEGDSSSSSDEEDDLLQDDLSSLSSPSNDSLL